MCPPKGSDGEGYIGAGPCWKPARKVDSLSDKDDSHPHLKGPKLIQWFI